jgi:hypothetical protein
MFFERSNFANFKRKILTNEIPIWQCPCKIHRGKRASNFACSLRESNATFESGLIIVCHFSSRPKGPDIPDAIRQRDAIFRFSLTDNFGPSLNFPNIKKRYNLLSYLVYISFKICSHWLFY